MTSVTDHRPPGEPGAGDTPPDLAPAAVARLRATFASGRTRPVEWRAHQLKGVRRLLSECEAELARAMAADLGRSRHDSWMLDLAPTRGEVDYALRHLSRWVKAKRVPLPTALAPGAGYYRHEPLGVVLVVGPWNYPVYLCLAPLVGALAAGNCAVVKPSEHAPASSAALADLLPRYVDSDAVAVVEGDATATRQLIDAPMDHIFFTGGTETGRKVMQAAAAHLTPVTLELGGKSPAIVTRHADLDVAARRIAWGKLLNSGQTCVAPDYVLVDDAVKDPLVSRLRSSLTAMRAGQPDVQRIVDDRQYRRLVALVEGSSGTVVAGGGHRDQGVEPTIVVDPDPDSPLMREEIFGPVLPVLGVGGLGEAIGFVRERPRPLAAYVFSEDRTEQERVFAEVACGGATANHTVMHLLAPQLPFGGIGPSGMGAYHGRWGFETFSHRKPTLVMRSHPDMKLIYPPYSALARKLMRRLL